MTRRILKRLLRLMPPALSFACGAAVMLLFLQPAHADPLIAVTPTGLDLSWQAWLMVGLAAAGGALKILDVLIAGLRWLAPRTETTLDDRAADDLQLVHDKLDTVVRIVGGFIPATGVPTTVADPKPAAPPLAVVPPPGSSGAALLVVLLLGALAAPVLTGCTAAQARQAAGAGFLAAFDCEGQHFDPAMLDDLRGFARDKVDGWFSGKAPADLPGLLDKVKADLGAFRSDAGRCAIAAVLAAATTIASPPASGDAGTAISALSATPAGPDPVAVRAAFGAAARELGWAPVKVAGGTVL